MLYLLYGSDTQRARAKAQELRDVLLTKKPDATLVSLDSDNVVEISLDELLGGQALFERKLIIFADQIFDAKEVKELWLQKLKEINESENIVILLLGEIDATSLKKLEKNATKTQVFDGKSKSKIDFNIFSLTDALGRRDKKSLWLLFCQAIEAGKEPEEIHGILFWQVKAMLTAKQAKSANVSGLKPFVYQKSLSFAKNFSDEELRATSDRLVELYHQARRGLVDFDIGLEKFVLSV